MGNYQTKKLQHVFAIAVVLVLSLSAIAKPKSKNKYDIRHIPEVAVDSTIREVLLQEVIPALEAHSYRPFSWMCFVPRDFFSGYTEPTPNIVGSAYIIDNSRFENPNLYCFEGGFCKIGGKTVFFDDTTAPYVKKIRNAKCITLKYLNAKIVHSCNFDPDVVRIVRSADGYKVIYPDYWDK